jgi:hypothetical protein
MHTGVQYNVLSSLFPYAEIHRPMYLKSLPLKHNSCNKTCLCIGDRLLARGEPTCLARPDCFVRASQTQHW